MIENYIEIGCGELNNRLRWRLAKLVILSWARKVNKNTGKEIEVLERELSDAYKRASISSTLIDELVPLQDDWRLPVEQGIKWLNGDDDVLSGLDDRDRAIIAQVRLEDHKRFLDECYKQK